MTIYMPRSGFADFLLYVPEGQDVYVVPRGKVTHDTAWAEIGLEPYKNAWHLLKVTSPETFERKVEAMSNQLQRIVAEAEKHNLHYELIRTRRAERRSDYRTSKQRRILINGKRCAIYTASMLPDQNTTCDIAYFSAPKDDWAEFLLYLLNDDAYVFPSSHFSHHDTTLSLDSSYVFDYRNAWCLLEGVDPTSWKEMREYRKRFVK